MGAAFGVRLHEAALGWRDASRPRKSGDTSPQSKTSKLQIPKAGIQMTCMDTGPGFHRGDVLVPV